MSRSLPRCPHCGIATDLAPGDTLPQPEHFSVCAGCARASRFSPDCRRLRSVEVEELPERERRAITAVQGFVRKGLALSGGAPVGHSYRAATLCRPCWDEFTEGREPVIVEGRPWDNCAFCERLTQSGISLPLLLPHRTLRAPEGVLS